MMVTSPPPAASTQLEGHLDAIAVGFVEDQLALALEGVVGGIQLTRLCRIGDLFHTDDHVHGFTSYRPVDGSPKPNDRIRRPEIRATQERHARERRRSPLARLLAVREPTRTASTISAASMRAPPNILALVACSGGAVVSARRRANGRRRRSRRGALLRGMPRRDLPSRVLRILLVVNSFASSVTARNTVVVHRRLARRHDVDVVETNRRGHATRFAHDAARRGVDVVIGYGGDGTLNEVATGIAGTDTALGVLPGGSTNVFARTLGMPNDPVAAADLLADGLDAADLRPIGLGRVNGRFFCFHTGIGFDAKVVQAVERHASLKRWLGHPLFISAGLSTWVRGYDRKHPHFRVDGGDHGVIDDGYFSIVLNTNPYTYLGNRPLDLSPAATLDRGLVVVTFRTLRGGADPAGPRVGAPGRRRAGERRSRRMARRRSARREPPRSVPLSARRRLSRLGRPPRVRPRSRCRAVGLSRLVRLIDGHEPVPPHRARSCRCRRFPIRSARACGRGRHTSRC